MEAKNIVFDLGGVLIRFDGKKYLKENVAEEKRDAFYYNVLRTKEWLMLDRGTLSYEEAKKIFKKRSPILSNEIDRFFDKDFFDILTPIKENVELLHNLKKTGKYKLYVLSNFHREAFEWIFEKNEFFKVFDGCLVSCYFKLLKPEKEIYETLLQEFGLKAEETLFIDDVEKNIEACEKIGMKGLHLPDYTKLSEELQNNNIL